MSTLIRSKPLLGTLVEIWGNGDDRAEVADAIGEAFAEIARIQSLLSYHERDSQISKINRLEVAKPLQIDPETYRLLETAQELHRASGGVFDVTSAGRLLGLGFTSRADDLGESPDYGTWNDVELCGENVIMLHRRVRIDLSGIAKGYAVDCAYDVMVSRGIESFCINAGGDLRLRSTNLLMVSLRHPEFPSITADVVCIDSGAVATSAGYFNARSDSEGNPVTPLLNPLTGKTGWEKLSATVIAPTCTIADALTKVVHADPAGAEEAVRRFGGRYILLSPDGEGGVQIIRSDEPAERG